MSRVAIQNFDEALKPLMGVEQALCIFSETCGHVPALEHNGDFFSCDHFVDREHYVGNIRETPLVEMLESPVQQEFGRWKRDGLPRRCRECEVLAMCNGGCPKDRFLHTSEGEKGLNYLCAGMHAFFTYSRPYLQQLAAFMLSGRPLDRFTVLQPERDAAPARRNDPCPCGSGRKYKKCCLQNSF